MSTETRAKAISYGGECITGDAVDAITEHAVAIHELLAIRTYVLSVLAMLCFALSACGGTTEPTDAGTIPACCSSVQCEPGYVVDPDAGPGVTCSLSLPCRDQDRICGGDQ